MSSSSNSNIHATAQPIFSSASIATTKKPTVQQRKLTQSVSKQIKNNGTGINNKENQEQQQQPQQQTPISIPKSCKLTLKYII